MFLHLTQIVTEKKKILIIKITWPPNNNNKHQYQSLSIYNFCWIFCYLNVNRYQITQYM